jgi:hypothetical protein
MARVQLFLSTVSAEFLSYRDRLRHLLTRPDVEVKVQEDFIVTGDETLEMLDTYIQGCDGVIHLIGDMTGAMAKPQNVEAITKRYPDLASRFQLGEFLQPNGPTLSYTQWEAWLALLHRKKLYIATAQPEAPRHKTYHCDSNQQELQQAHLARLRRVARYPGSGFTSPDDLAASVLRSFVLDLLVKAESYEQPQLSSLSDPRRTICIFLASSSELKEDRDAFDLYFRQENDRLLKQGIYLEIQRWENFLDAMSESGLQDEYNLAVSRSDILVSLFKTKTGRYTEQEFAAAHKAFAESGKPLIYTFFKSGAVSANKRNREALLSLWAFQDKLSGLGHYHTQYTSSADLKLQFRRQLDKLIDDGRLIKGPNPTKDNKKARYEVLQQIDQIRESPNKNRTNNKPQPSDQPFLSETDLVIELQIAQELQERGVINKNNAIIIQAQKISEIRILRSTRP